MSGLFVSFALDIWNYKYCFPSFPVRDAWTSFPSVVLGAGRRWAKAYAGLRNGSEWEAGIAGGMAWRSLAGGVLFSKAPDLWKLDAVLGLNIRRLRIGGSLLIFNGIFSGAFSVDFTVKPLCFGICASGDSVKAGLVFYNEEVGIELGGGVSCFWALKTPMFRPGFSVVKMWPYFSVSFSWCPEVLSASVSLFGASPGVEYVFSLSEWWAYHGVGVRYVF